MNIKIVIYKDGIMTTSADLEANKENIEILKKIVDLNITGEDLK